MAFSNDVVEAAWRRSGGICECNRVSHSNHPGREHRKRLVKSLRGVRGADGAWEAHHRVSTGPDTLSNCEILCWECHNLTF